MGKKICLRPTRLSDEPFLLSLFGAVRAPGYERSGGHPSMPSTIYLQFKAREQALGSNYPAGEDRLIEVNGMAVGRLRITRDESSFHIADLTILPEHQRRGIGTALMGDLIEEARRAGLPIRVVVLQPDLTAFRFFRRLGFDIADQNVSYVYLEWRAS